MASAPSAVRSLGSRVVQPLRRYARWLHTGWPAGTVEPLPEVAADGKTQVPGLYIAGDLVGTPLLKLAADGGARVVEDIARDPAFARARARVAADAPELLIIGAGIAGCAAALRARALGIRFVLIEAAQPFATISNFPAQKPIYTYPKELTPAGELQISAAVKEDLLAELRAQAGDLPVRCGRLQGIDRGGAGADGQLVARLEGGDDGAPFTLSAPRVLLAIGRSGDFRRLDVPGEELDKVFNRLHDPRDYAGQRVLVVGGGDSAAEAAIALCQAGADVTLCHRGADLSRPKAENREAVEALAAAGRLRLRLSTRVRRIEAGQVVLAPAGGADEALGNDAVFPMLGRAAPVDLLRRCGVAIRGERTPRFFIGLAAFFLFCVALYNWKSGGGLWAWHQRSGLPSPHTLAPAAPDRASLLGVLRVSASGPSFYYTLAYSLVVVLFGLRRVRRTPTPYIKLQTLCLSLVQILPLFLLPEILLPWLGHHGLLPRGLLDSLFPAVDYGHGREYWRAYGLVLAWPLFVYNVFTDTPHGAWLAISLAQTFVIIPLLVYRYGKGAYCGWICSCGALAETLGDGHREKMPHGPRWNRLNLIGQGILLVALLLLALRVAGWLFPSLGIGQWFWKLVSGADDHRVLRYINYKWVVDVFLAGAVGYGVYFWYSGRAWCRFLCPLAALMHIYARFSRFRIFADKKKCISCNVCTSVCHMGIDVMSFANKGRPMEDVECVRCSACVSRCPTGVLRFGRLGADGGEVPDRVPASPLHMKLIPLRVPAAARRSAG